MAESPLHVAVVSLFAPMFDAVSEYGVTGRAVKNGLIQIDHFSPRDYAEDRHKTVDDRPFGGGPGMVMKLDPLRAAIDEAKQRVNGPVLALSPQGKVLKQKRIAKLAEQRQFVLVAGRYEGIDERAYDQLIDEEISLGDFVLSGGELAAMAVIDACARLVPGVLGHDASAVEDSFAGEDGFDGWLDHPHYTRPEQHDLGNVPSVLMSGDHKAIQRWRLKQALGRTWLRRPDLLQGRELSSEQRSLLTEFIREHWQQANAGKSER